MMFRLFSVSVLIVFSVSQLPAIEVASHQELIKLVAERSDTAAISLLQRLQSEKPESLSLAGALQWAMLLSVRSSLAQVYHRSHSYRRVEGVMYSRSADAN
ncbi:hypothetical protein [Leptolyngbya sp. 7M]|uniref:hypothetical protein n=1 Tax=Leptolyngbya sp. 7M TaxID=2812896 RepID=UPI001B8DA9FB|nr:hypothetical protein [Leptolyngbya sp. 7M]QYO65463.1 hypothetical protein JVX88_01355 [Leptolyngbya sp. 7M]